jgi:NhaP-type Na+/H+ or K+/H+ antiporter
MVLFYQVAGKLIETHNCSFLHESTVGILAGLLIAFFVNKVHAGTVIQFSEKGFFLFILPPIIFAAGYTLKKKNFIRNISYIFALGIFGTLIAMGTISVILTFFNQYGLEFDNEEGLDIREGNWIMPNECMLLAAVLCSTDTVAVLTLVTADKYSILNSVLFGEGVINDAVAILLFKAIENVMKSGSETGSFGKD